MINRYTGEIHVNPMRLLRNDDFNNEGHIRNIDETLKEAVSLTKKISERLQQLIDWLGKNNAPGTLQFHFAEGGYIAIKGLQDSQLLQLKSKGWIELFDNATSKEWVKKYGPQFGLIWEDGRAVEI